MKRTLKKYLSRTFLTLILIVLLVGCREKTTLEVTQTSQPTSGPTLPLSTATPFSTQGVIETVKPTLSNFALSTAFAKTPTEVYSSPTPFLSPTPIPAALPFHDCARTPGITGCDQSAPSLAGHLAFYDAENNRLIGLDLKTGLGWAVRVSKPRALEWSPDGSRLLVRMNFPKDEPYEYLLFENGGKLIRQFSQDKNLYWQPQAAELRTYEERKIVRSKDGAEAWLEGTIEGKTLHFRKSAIADWKTAVLDVRPMEWPTELYGWIPGTSNILITNGSGSVKNDVMYGHQFYLFNTETEELRHLKDFNGHINPQFAALKEPYFAMLQLYWGLANDTLAILDGKTGDINYPLPHANSGIQPYSLWQLAWQPRQGNTDGLFVMMVRMLRANIPNPPPVTPMFPKDGIYLYNQALDQAQIIRETAEDITGGNFYWTADGQYLLYNLGPFITPENAQTSLYVRQMETGKEWLMLDHLANPDQFVSYISWNLIAISIH